jgi:hypothetical protein
MSKSDRFESSEHDAIASVLLMQTRQFSVSDPKTGVDSLAAALNGSF